MYINECHIIFVRCEYQYFSPITTLWYQALLDWKIYSLHLGGVEKMEGTCENLMAIRKLK